MNEPALRPNVELGEWASILLDGVELTARDRVLIEGPLGPRLKVTELRTGLRIQSTGWVGVVRFDAATIRVQPRLLDGHEQLLRLLGFVSGLDLLKRLKRPSRFAANRDDFFDLLARLLAEACSDVWAAGLNADYVPERDELAVLRGRLDLKAQMFGWFGRIDRLVCNFEERSRSIPENQWLLRALRIARRGVQDPDTRRLVSRIASVFEEAAVDDPVHPLDEVIITRVNRHYRRALELSYLVVSGSGISNLLRDGNTSGFSFLLSMPRLFERFVAAGLAQLYRGSGVRIDSQAGHRFALWDVLHRQTFAKIRPDVVLSDSTGDERLPVDANYKDVDQRGADQGDVYQGAIYGLTLSNQTPGRCVLIHPSTSAPGKRHEVHVRVAGQSATVVDVVSLSVAEWLEELQSNRLGAQSRLVMESLGFGGAVSGGEAPGRQLVGASMP